MPSPTYTAIATTVLTSSASSVTFSAIPSTYTDLVLVYSARDNASGNVAGSYTIRVNGLSTTIYSYTALSKNDSSVVSSYRGSSQDRGYWGIINGSGATANTFGSGEFYIPNYTGSTNKIVSISEVTENNNANATYINVDAALIGTTSSINEITFFSFFNNVASGSRFDLYGIKNS